MKLLSSFRKSVCVESDGSKKLEADIAAGCIDSLFRKSPATAMAEEETVGVPSLSFCIVSFAELGEWRLSGSVKSKSIGCCGSAAAGRGSQLCEAAVQVEP
jgi:hypothetical protein